MKVNCNLGQIWQRIVRCLPMALLTFDVILIAIMYALIVAFAPTLNGDNIEHIHSGFLVANGAVPYRDFFQHHNPLLWYLFAPLIKLFAYNATIAEVVCFVSFLVFLKSLVYVYKISAEFLSDKLWAVATVVAVALPGYRLYAIDFRPDNYMVFCLMGGLYYYFSYLKDKKTFHLIVSFVWFFISFLFAQKALFPLAFLGVSGLYFWRKGEILTKDLGKALIIPVIGFFGFVGYLWHYDMVELYYKSNYTFNLELVNGFVMGKIADFPSYMLVFVWLAVIGVVGAIKTGNKYWLVLALLFVSEFLQRKMYFSPYAYYYWFLSYMAVLCGMPVLYALNRRFKIVIWVVIAILSWFMWKIGCFQYNYVMENKNRPYLPDYIARQITPCDYVFNGDGMMYNLFGRDPAYYWQLIGQLDVIGEKVGIVKKPNVEGLILQLKPKFIYGRNYFNKFADESGKPEIVHYVSKDVVEKYYDKTPFSAVYRLKAEYDNRKCVKDADDGKWDFKK